MDDKNLKPEGRTGSVKLLGRLNRYWFSVEVKIMREGLNNNKWDYRNIKEHYLSFLGQPILIAYVGGKIGDGHNMRPVRMPDGGTEYTFIDGSAERVIGTLSEKEEDFRVEEINGNLWIVAKGKIFSFYAREAVEKIIDTGSMDVSAETEIYDGETSENGVEIFTDWAGLGVTILGDDVPPAIPGARIKAMNASAEIKVMNQCSETLMLKDDSNRQGKKNKKGVKHDMNKREYARLQKQFDGYTVLGATDNGLNVCLLSDKDGAAVGYRFADEADKSGILPERICNMSVNCQFVFDEENTVDIELGQVTETLTAKLLTANAAIEEKDKKIADLEAKVKDMEAKEIARRVNDAKKAVMSRLDVLNRDRDARCAYGKQLADEVCARCEKGCFNECMGEDGEWCGDKMAVMELEAACAREQEKFDKEAAEKAKKAVSWNEVNLNSGLSHSESDTDELIAWVKQQ